MHTTSTTSDAAGAVDVWEWTPGRSWRRVLELVPSTARGALADALVYRPTGTTRATFSTVLDFDPNHAGADEILELAEQIAGAVPDTTPRRRHQQ